MKQEEADKAERQTINNFNIVESPPEHSIKETAIMSVYSYQATYEQLRAYFKNHYQPLNLLFNLNELHDSLQLKLKKYKESVYYGEFASNKKQGYGIMLYNNGRVYEGNWRNDQRNAFGCQRFANGCQYQGEYLEGKMQGIGKYIWNTGSSYEGQWKNNLRHGSGMWRSQKNDVYLGQWAQGKATGYGVFQESNGNKYQGQFQNFIKEGEGLERFQNGDIYQGNFHKGRFSGYGEFVWTNGSYYKGIFLYGKRNGQGVWKKNPDKSDKYEGEYKENKKEGYGVFTWAQGDVYKGNYLSDQRHGFGEMYWADGSYYIGNWKKGVENGKGQFYVAGEGKKIGIFENGVFVEPEIEKDSSEKQVFHLSSKKKTTNESEDYSLLMTPKRDFKSNFANYESCEEAKLIRFEPKRYTPSSLLENGESLTKKFNTLGVRKTIKQGNRSNNAGEVKEKTLHSAFYIHRLYDKKQLKRTTNQRSANIKSINIEQNRVDTFHMKLNELKTVSHKLKAFSSKH